MVCWSTRCVPHGGLFDMKQHASSGGLSVLTFLIAINALVQKC